MRAAVEHLARIGHRKIGFLAGPHTLRSAITRENDFRTAMQAARLPVEKPWVIECDHTLRGGVAGFERLQSFEKGPTPGNCSNHTTPICRRRGPYPARPRLPPDPALVSP